MPPSKPSFLLVDEAQTSYNGTWFWNSLIKSVNDGAIDLYIVLFSCYGSATGEALGIRRGPTSVLLAGDQLIELQWRGVHFKPIGLLLKKEEAEDILRKRYNLKLYPFKISTELIHVMYGLSGEHV